MRAGTGPRHSGGQRGASRLRPSIILRAGLGAPPGENASLATPIRTSVRSAKASPDTGAILTFLCAASSGVDWGMSSRHQRGFTLLEILVAALIIGVLAAVSIPNALQARIRGNDNAAQVLLGTLAAAQEARKADSLDRSYWPVLGPENAQLYDPATDAESGFLDGLKPPSEYRAYAVTLKDSRDVTHYCVDRKSTRLN